MENTSLDNFENNKEGEMNDSSAKRLAALLLPKMENQPKNKFNYNNLEKKFYKTAGKGFGINKKNKSNKFVTDKFNNDIQKRIGSSNINPKYFTSNNFFNLNKNNDNNIIKALQEKINEIENELENN